MLAPWPLVFGPCSLVLGFFEMSNILFEKMPQPLSPWSPVPVPWLWVPGPCPFSNLAGRRPNQKINGRRPTKIKNSFQKSCEQNNVYFFAPLCGLFLRPNVGGPSQSKMSWEGPPTAQTEQKMANHVVGVKKWGISPWNVFLFWGGGAGGLFAPIGQPKGWLETKSGKINF